MSAEQDDQIAWMARKYRASGNYTDDVEANQRAAFVIGRSKDNMKSISLTVQDEFQKHLNRVGIMCLTGTRENLLMWSHYAHNHRGLCIGFRTRREKDFFDAAREVTYQTKYPVIAAFVDDDATKLKLALLVKSECWAYEREYRILDPHRSNYLREYEPENLASITFGALVDPQVRAMFERLVRSTSGEIRLEQAKLAGNEFRLTFAPID